LADVLGNFVNRTLKFTETRFGAAIPEGGAPGAREAKLTEDLERRFGLDTAHLEDLQFRKAAAELRACWVLGNEYLAETAPWTAIKSDRAAAALSVRTAFNLIRLFACLSQPIIPFAAEAMTRALRLDAKSLHWPKGKIAGELTVLKADHAFTPPAQGEVLFAKIAPEQIAAWEARFGGA
jgi:methionyl-tRNA synthetase